MAPGMAPVMMQPPMGSLNAANVMYPVTFLGNGMFSQVSRTDFYFRYSLLIEFVSPINSLVIKKV